MRSSSSTRRPAGRRERGAIQQQGVWHADMCSCNAVKSMLYISNFNYDAVVQAMSLSGPSRRSRTWPALAVAASSHVTAHQREFKLEINTQPSDQTLLQIIRGSVSYGKQTCSTPVTRRLMTCWPEWRQAYNEQKPPKRRALGMVRTGCSHRGTRRLQHCVPGA